jgi:hypothetical protein
MPVAGVDADVRRQARGAAIWAGRGLFKGTALIAAFALIVAVWLRDAALLTATADYNLWLIRAASGLLPGDWPSRVESALRMFGADRALLLSEAVLLAKMMLVAAAYPFVLAARGIRARLRRRRQGAAARVPSGNQPRASGAPANPAPRSRGGDI